MNKQESKPEVLQDQCFFSRADFDPSIYIYNNTSEPNHEDLMKQKGEWGTGD